MASSRLCARVSRACLNSANARISLRSTQTRLYACRRWTVHPSVNLVFPARSYSTDVIPPAAIEGQDKEYAPKIQTLVDDISKLTLLEVADLNELLKKTLNIADTPMMPMGGMVAAPAKEAEEEEEAEATPQKTFFAVKLTGFDSGKKVALIKEIKAIVPGMNLVQAKKFVETTPQTVLGDLTKEEAETLKKSLEAAGGTVSVD